MASSWKRTLEETFAEILENSPMLRLRTNVNDLMEYAEMDTRGGRDTYEFPDGVSVYRKEGQVLYALIRELKPENCLEFGCAVGGSSTHILQALEDNQSGQLVSVDLNPDAGSMIPDELRKRWTLLVGDAQEIKYDAPVDFVFEDTDHTYETTSLLLREAAYQKPMCVISHDYVLCEAVQRAFDEVFDPAVTVALLGTNMMETGMGIWVR